MNEIDIFSYVYFNVSVSSVGELSGDYHALLFCCISLLTKFALKQTYAPFDVTKGEILLPGW